MRSISNSADQVVEQVKDTASHAKGSFLELGTQIFRFMNTLRDMEIRGTDTLLDKMGLQRRASPFTPALWLVAGAVAGGAAAMALSPVSGKQLRRRLAQLLDQGIEEVKLAEAKVEGAVHDAKSKVEGAVHDAKSKVEGAVHDAKSKVDGVVHDAKSKVEGAVHDTTSKVESAAHDAKRTATSAASNLESRVNNAFEDQKRNAFEDQKRNNTKPEQHTGR